MFKLLKFILSFYKKTIRFLGFCFRQFFCFIYSNWVNLIKRTNPDKTFPKIQLYTKCEGSWTAEVGNHCSFGYKIGGFHHGGSIDLQPRYKNTRITIGNNISTNNNIKLCASNYIEIGDNSLIGKQIARMDHEIHGIRQDKRNQIAKIEKVVI
jgi:hypothetical protein